MKMRAAAFTLMLAGAIALPASGADDDHAPRHMFAQRAAEVRKQEKLGITPAAMPGTVKPGGPSNDGGAAPAGKAKTPGAKSDQPPADPAADQGASDS